MPDTATTLWLPEGGDYAGGMAQPCSVGGCDHTAVARTWCQTHYSRWRLYGSPHKTLLIRGDDLARIETKFDRRGVDECWPWTEKLDQDSYGTMWYQGRNRGAHVVAHLLWVGPVAKGQTVDHVCHNEAAARGECAGGPGCLHRRCVNPRHLDATTNRMNLARSPVSVASRNSAKTHCPQGHAYDEANTYWATDGSRCCRACYPQRLRGPGHPPKHA